MMEWNLRKTIWRIENRAVICLMKICGSEVMNMCYFLVKELLNVEASRMFRTGAKQSRTKQKLPSPKGEFCISFGVS